MRKIHKKGDNYAWSEGNISIGSSFNDIWEEYDVSDIQDWNDIKKSKTKRKKYAVKKRQIKPNMIK